MSGTWAAVPSSRSRPDVTGWAGHVPGRPGGCRGVRASVGGGVSVPRIWTGGRGRLPTGVEGDLTRRRATGRVPGRGATTVGQEGRPGRVVVPGGGRGARPTRPTDGRGRRVSPGRAVSRPPGGRKGRRFRDDVGRRPGAVRPGYVRRRGRDGRVTGRFRPRYATGGRTTGGGTASRRRPTVRGARRRRPCVVGVAGTTSRSRRRRAGGSPFRQGLA